MRLTRIHLPALLRVDSEILLPTSGGNHLVRVLRQREGASLIVFDGLGNEHHAQICRIDGQRVYVRIGQKTDPIKESPLQLTLVQAISRSDRMDWSLQKATELGVSTIVPVLSSRSVVRLDDKQSLKKQEHWQAIVISACEQSGRSVVPTVQLPTPLNQYISSHAKSGIRLVLSPNATTPLTRLEVNANHVALLIGPEGGLEEDEIHLAEQAGFTPVSLGPRILRTETAAVVALSVLQARWGDLK